MAWTGMDFARILYKCTILMCSEEVLAQFYKCKQIVDCNELDFVPYYARWQYSNEKFQGSKYKCNNKVIEYVQHISLRLTVCISYKI